MPYQKVVRSLCFFTDDPASNWLDRIRIISDRLEQNDYIIQTQRVCFGGLTIQQANDAVEDPTLYISVGTLSREEAHAQHDAFIKAGNVHFNMDITSGVDAAAVHVLFETIQHNASKTFHFTYTVNNPPHSPYFPSARYEQPGFAIGLQPTNLSSGCHTVEAWLGRMRIVWDELLALFGDELDFLGIDSSVAPLFDGDSSLVQFIERVYKPFGEAVTTDVFTRITNFIKKQNPRPVGLNGLMLPCLEDAGLAQLYTQGAFSIERNLFLALHCGLGIDTYPIGVDEAPERVLEVLCLLRALSLHHQKPLSARFISDGRTRIGEQTDFQNQYLQDTIVRKL